MPRFREMNSSRRFLLCTCCDDSYAAGLFVMLASLKRNAHELLLQSDKVVMFAPGYQN